MKKTSLINDVIDLIVIKSKDIEHYRQYPIALIFFIMLLLVAQSTFLFKGNDSSIFSVVIIDLIFAFVFTFLNAIFLMYWFGRVGKKYSFLIFLHYDVMLSIAASIPFLVILFVMKNFDSSPWVGFIGGLGGIFYVVYMFSFNLANATDSSKKFALGAILISLLLQGITEAVFL